MMENMPVHCMGGFGMGFMMLVHFALAIWFFVFSILVLVKLGKISKQLSKD